MLKLKSEFFMGIFLLFLSPPLALQPNSDLSRLHETSVSLQLLDLGQSVGLIGRMISSSQGLYLYTNTDKRTHNINTKYSCPEWNSNPRSRSPSERRQFMPQTAELPWPAISSVTLRLIISAVFCPCSWWKIGLLVL
jgi:hypothetical protein